MDACTQWNLWMIATGSLLSASAFLNVMITRHTIRLSQRARSLDSSWRGVVNAAVDWEADFGTPEHPLAISKLREAVYAMKERERELLK